MWKDFSELFSLFQTRLAADIQFSLSLSQFVRTMIFIIIMMGVIFPDMYSMVIIHFHPPRSSGRRIEVVEGPVGAGGEVLIVN